MSRAREELGVHNSIPGSGEEERVSVPTVKRQCGGCRGRGMSSAYLGAFTQEDRMQDPEFFEDYMAGEYDRTCDVCRGCGTVTEVDPARCTDDQWQRHLDELRENAEYEAMVAAEVRMGC